MLWAIACVFNPCGYGTKIENYRKFRAALTVPLVTVELGFDAPFELNAADADILVQIRGGDIMFQKERLLNIALAQLPAECTAVAWLDADIRLERDDWADRSLEALERSPVVQPFGHRYRLEKHTPNDFDWAAKHLARFDSFGKGWSEGTVDKTTWESPTKGRSAVGLAWCARREILDELGGLYDAAIIGGGVRLAVMGFVNIPVRGLLGAAAQPHLEHLERWTTHCYDLVRGNLSYVDGGVITYWHGEMSDRNYDDRYALLARTKFDPERDLTVSDSGAWVWNSDKPDLHREVADYFRLRREDG